MRQALDAAGIVTPGIERMAADVLAVDGLPRFVWTDEQPDPSTYTSMSPVAKRLARTTNGTGAPLRPVLTSSRWADLEGIRDRAGVLRSPRDYSLPPTGRPRSPGRR